MRHKNRLIAVLVAAVLLMSICPVSFAASPNNDRVWTESEVAEKIESGEIEFTFEARDLSDFTEEEIAANEGLQQLVLDAAKLQTRGRRDNTVPGKVYTLTANVDASTELKCFSMPYAALAFYDIGSSENVSTQFYVYEYVTLNGVRVDSWSNYITYSNISVAFGCGENTVFSRNPVIMGDNKRGSNLSIDFAGIFGILTSVAGFNGLSALINAFNSVTYKGQEATTTVIEARDTVRVFAVKWNSSIDLIDNDAYVQVESSATTYDTTKPKNVSTTAAARWTFDVFTGTAHLGSLATGVTLVPNVTYLSNHSN